MASKNTNNFLKFGAIFSFIYASVKPRCCKPYGHYPCTPELGRLGCVISIKIGVPGDAYPVAISQKVTKSLPVSFYSPTQGFKHEDILGKEISWTCYNLPLALSWLDISEQSKLNASPLVLVPVKFLSRSLTFFTLRVKTSNYDN